MNYSSYNEKFVNTFFWRNYNQQEIDYMEKGSGKIEGFEFKFSSTKKIKQPTEFVKTYLKDAKVERVDKDNIWSFVS